LKNSRQYALRAAMTDVFISYKHRMRPKVDLIARELKALGLTVWYDED
jgi:hypothetical protein